MASEIRVNRLSNRSGLSTITFANGGVQFSGITTFANGEFYVGTGATIINPGTNEFNFHTGGSNRFTINNSGANLGTGNITAVDATFTGNVSIGKTLTYEDVKNVDSVGVVTARTGVKVTGGDFTVGTAITASVATGNVTQDVGITTFSGSATWFKGLSANKDMYWSKSSGSLIFKDTAAALFGDSSDLQIYHNGSSSFISDEGQGSLKITTNGTGVDIQKGSSETIARFIADGECQLYYDNVKKFDTKTNGVEIHGHLITGDSNEIRLGNSSDLKIFHNGTHNQILGTQNQVLYFGTNNNNRWSIANDGHLHPEANNTYRIGSGSAYVANVYSVNFRSPDGGKAVFGDSGDLEIHHTSSWNYIQGSSSGVNLAIQAKNGENSVIAIPDGKTSLYYDGDEKLETTSTGVTISAGNLVLGDNQQIQLGSNDLRLYHSSSAGDSYIEGTSRDIIIKTTTSNFIAFQTNDTSRLNITGGGEIQLTGSVTLSSNAPSVKGTLRISGYSDYSTAGGIEFHTSSGGGAGYGSRITSDTAGNMHFNTRSNHSAWSERLRIASDGKLLVGATAATGAENWLFRKDVSGGGDGCRLTIYNADNSSVNNQAKLTLKTNHSEVIFSQYNQGEVYISNSHANSYFMIYLAGTSKFRLNANGSHTLNHPIVFAYAPATTQSLTDATWTKNTWLTSEDIDTDNAFSSSRFTVPSGKGGKYFIAVGNNLYGNDNNIRNARTAIYKNGSLYSRSYNVVFSTSSSGLRHFTAEQQCVATLAAGDYIENYMICDVNSGLVYLSSDSWGVRGNYMLIYRIG